MTNVRQFFLFTLGERLLALPLEVVERVIAMVEVTPLPSMPVAPVAKEEATTSATPTDDETSISTTDPTIDTESEIWSEAAAPLGQVRGVINVQGRIVMVVDVRAWLGLEEREAQLSDRLLILRVGDATMALVAEAVQGVVGAGPADWADAGQIAPSLDIIQGALKVGDDVVWVVNPDTLLPHDTREAKDVSPIEKMASVA